MQPIPFGVAEIRVVSARHWIEPRVGVNVDDLRRPDVARLLHDIDVVVDEQAELVRERFVGLHVRRTELRIAAVVPM